MINLNSDSFKMQKIALTSLAFLTINTSQANALDRFESDLREIKSQTTLHPETLEERQYTLVGVALFSGRDLASSTIKAVTHSKISHVGIILSDAENENKWYCFESTGSASEVLHGHYPHVRITSWEEVVANYSGKVSYRLFAFEDQDRTETRMVTDFVEAYDHKSYTKNPMRLFKALYKTNKESESKVLKTAFCSELAAKMLMDMGVMAKGSAGNYIPKDFTSRKSLPLAPGITLTPEFKAKT